MSDRTPEDDEQTIDIGRSQPSDVRLITREEADAASNAPNVINKRSKQATIVQPSFPTILDDDDSTTIDLRVTEVHDDDLPEARLPHWTEPATGEVPIAIAADDPPEMSGPRWRAQSSWAKDDHPELSDLGAASRLGEINDTPVEEVEGELEPSVGRYSASSFDRGAVSLGQVKSGEDSFFGDNQVLPTVSGENGGVNDEQESETQDLGARFREGVPEHGIDPEVRTPEPRHIDTVSLTKRVITGGAFAIAAIGAFAAGPVWVLTLAAVVLLLAGAEYFDALRRVGFRPATLLGLFAIAGMVAGGYARGEAAIPLVIAMSVVFTFLWYLTGVIKDSPTANIAVTLLGIVWIGALGSFAALLLRAPNREGMAFLLGAVLATIAYDTAAYLGGSFFGKHKLSPAISPNKSWEGLAAGTIAAVALGAVLSFTMSPWTLAGGLLLGLVVSCVAPLGDLAESMVKRDLGLKDMGRILPGHGGVLDRFDAMLLVFPATYYLVLLLNL